MKIRNFAKWIFILSAVCVAMVTASPAQTFTVIKQFNGLNGGGPEAPPVEGLDGSLYGTTEYGGANYGGTSTGNGTVFRLTPKAKLTTLHSFCATTGCADGAAPWDALALGTDGRFYGTASALGQNGNGTVFTITPQGTLSTIYSFCGDPDPNCLDGQEPTEGLVQGSDGYFYGTTWSGSTVFKTGYVGGRFFTTLYTFCATSGCPDGTSPKGTLVQGTDGNFYGTTFSGGAYNQGTVFRISPAGILTTLHSFCASTFSGSCTDGANPESGVVEGADGNFYGTTTSGGSPTYCTAGCGIIFKITPQGMLTTLYNLTFPSTDGQRPNGLVQATDGNLYGTTSKGGAYNHGTIFQITPGNTLTTLHSFTGSDGVQTYARLMQKTDGNFYGTAPQGGQGNFGTIFRLSVGLGPFVKTLPIAASQGQGVQILGANLTGTTNVTFNGIAANFVVVSATLIYTAVPSGATTGPVQVTTPGGVLTSNVAFQVLP